MAKAAKKTQDVRIKKERNRLVKIYKELPQKEFKTAEKLIDNIAFMSVTLEDLMEIVNHDSLIKETVNASQKFTKEHPALIAYNKMYANFLKGIQHLSSLLPKNSGDSKTASDGDELMEFLKNKKQ